MGKSMRELFRSETPSTVRIGAALLLFLTLVEVSWHVYNTWFGPNATGGIWGVVRPAIGLLAGLFWVWGIARMIGLFYWSYVVLSSLLLVALVVDTVVSWLSNAGNRVASDRSIFGVIGLPIWLLTFGFLVARPSLHAFRHRGRPGGKSGVG